MSPGLLLGPGFRLPLDVVTESVAILAKRRAGKSFLARRLAEELHTAGQQLVIVDPKGDWWGIRSAADGKAPGLPIVICGGERGDVPLEVHGGELVAELVVRERVSVLLDLSRFRKSQVATFMTGFLETLYRLKAQDAYRTPVMVIIDEADAIAPQRPQHGEERMLGAADDLVRRGGQRGIGVTMITQRPAVLNKNVLTQCGLLITLRMMAPQDLQATEAWIKQHGTKAEHDTLMASLPALPTGTAWFWAPGWPTPAGIFARVAVLPIRTFDSGATPTAGAKRSAPKKVADVDLAAFTARMAETIEQAKANDPRVLKARIAELQKSLQQMTAVKATPTAVSRPGKPVPVLTEGALARLERCTATLGTQLAGVIHALEKLQHGSPPAVPPAVPVRTVSTGITHGRVAPAVAPRHPRQTNDLRLGQPEQRILNALAWLASIGNTAPEGPAVAFLAGYSFGGGAFNNPRSRLRSLGLIEYQGSRLMLTATGATAAETPTAALTTAALHAAVLARLPTPEQRVLVPLLAAYPATIAMDDLARMAGYAPGAGSFNNPRSRLRTLGLIDYFAGPVARARDILFVENR